eukprot:125189-Chlamydomonas_euryale.AAC.1
MLQRSLQNCEQALVCPPTHTLTHSPAFAPLPLSFRSNAATDELLERVIKGGFRDFGGNRYDPPIA